MTPLEQIKSSSFDDSISLADILHLKFNVDDENEAADYHEVIQELHNNRLQKLGDWKELKDPELKKQFGVKVINVLDIAAGTLHVLSQSFTHYLFLQVSVLTGLRIESKNYKKISLLYRARRRTKELKTLQKRTRSKDSSQKDFFTNYTNIFQRSTPKTVTMQLNIIKF